MRHCGEQKLRLNNPMQSTMRTYGAHATVSGAAAWRAPTPALLHPVIPAVPSGWSRAPSVTCSAGRGGLLVKQRPKLPARQRHRPKYQDEPKPIDVSCPSTRQLFYNASLTLHGPRRGQSSLSDIMLTSLACSSKHFVHAAPHPTTPHHTSPPSTHMS